MSLMDIFLFNALIPKYVVDMGNIYSKLFYSQGMQVIVVFEFTMYIRPSTFTLRKQSSPGVCNNHSWPA